MSRSTPIIARIGGILLFVGVGMLAVAQLWLSDDHLATPLQPGLLLPVAAGVWILSLASARTRMDDLDNR